MPCGVFGEEGVGKGALESSCQELFLSGAGSESKSGEESWGGWNGAEVFLAG